MVPPSHTLDAVDTKRSSHRLTQQWYDAWILMPVSAASLSVLAIAGLLRLLGLQGSRPELSVVAGAVVLAAIWFAKAISLPHGRRH